MDSRSKALSQGQSHRLRHPLFGHNSLRKDGEPIALLYNMAPPNAVEEGGWEGT